ncbi:hypothetical protein VIBRN418_01623 [Vibrio sp. N418]|nr:hypothetical protein VIBRN418_01623 [Vibrio sp. N418]
MFEFNTDEIKAEAQHVVLFVLGIVLYVVVVQQHNIKELPTEKFVVKRCM